MAGQHRFTLAEWPAIPILLFDLQRPVAVCGRLCSGIAAGSQPLRDGKSGFDPNSGLNPLLSATAFQPVSTFDFNLGEGTRVSNVRGFGYHSEDIALTDNIPITERFRAQIRAEFFDAWNWHSFLGTPFVNDIASPSFGDWNGGVSSPRNIQLGVRFSF